MVRGSQSVALLPLKNLKLAPQTVINREHLVRLYRHQLKISNSFASYNFRHYFMRKTHEKFRTELPMLLDSNFASTSSSSSSAASTSSSSSSSSTAVKSAKSAVPSIESAPADRLREWYTGALEELAVLARAANVNNLYEAPRLVVETKGRSFGIHGGGGAGAEASYGGAGQPKDPNPDEPKTPAA